MKIDWPYNPTRAEATTMCFLWLVLGFFFGLALGVTCAKNEAIENNAAYWSIDAKTGKTNFEWVGEGRN